MTLSCKVLRTVYKFCPSSSTIWRVFNQRFNEFFDQRFDEFFWSTIWRVFDKGFCEISKYYSVHSASLCPEKLFGIHIFRGQVLSFSTTSFLINDLTSFDQRFHEFLTSVCTVQVLPFRFCWKIIWHPLFFEVKF